MTTSSTDARNKAHEAAGKAQEAAGKAMEAGQSVAGAVADKAREFAGTAQQAGQAAFDRAGQMAESATERVAQGMQSLGHTVREHGPSSGMFGSATQDLANTLEQGGRYVQQEGLRGMADDLTTLIKNNPIPALLVGIGLGFLLARITRS
jgi:hypothetical protein